MAERGGVLTGGVLVRGAAKVGHLPTTNSFSLKLRMQPIGEIRWMVTPFLCIAVHVNCLVAIDRVSLWLIGSFSTLKAKHFSYIAE